MTETFPGSAPGPQASVQVWDTDCRAKHAHRLTRLADPRYKHSCDASLCKTAPHFGRSFRFGVLLTGFGCGLGEQHILKRHLHGPTSHGRRNRRRNNAGLEHVRANDNLVGANHIAVGLDGLVIVDHRP